MSKKIKQPATIFFYGWSCSISSDVITEPFTKVIAQSLQFLPDSTTDDTLVEHGDVIDEENMEPEHEIDAI